MTKTIAIIGAKGLAGQSVLELIGERAVRCGQVYALALKTSGGEEVSYGDEGVLPLLDAANFDFSKANIVINAGGSAAADYLMKARKAGARVIDMSSKFRLDMDTPLIVPEVNGEKIGDHGLISGPNCMVTGIAAALKPLDDLAGLVRVHAVTFQSVSGVGKPAMDELFNQTRSIFVGEMNKGTEFPKQIAFNVQPQIGQFMDDRGTEEEWSIKAETKKILGGKFKMTVTATRVPVFIGHAAALHVEFAKDISAVSALEALRKSRGVAVIDLENEELEYMTQAEVAGENDVYVSRVREDSSMENGLALWVVLDNIHRGLALNAVQILEKII